MIRIRTGYSFHTAFGHLTDVAERLKITHQGIWPITDRCSTFGFNRWAKICKKNNAKPVFGVELAVTPRLGDSKPTLDYWTFIAKTDIKSVNQLVALATSNPGKEPSLTYAQALKAEGVFKIAGERCQLQYMEPQDDLFIALSPALPRGLYHAAKDKFKFAACSDNLYPTEADKELYRIALGRRSNTQTYPQWILSHEEWLEAVGDFDQAEAACRNAEAILQSSCAQLKKAELLKPEKPKSLRQLCEEGAAKLGVNLNDSVYSARLDRELNLIAEKKFEDYFFIIADLVNWAKERMIVGPARGSSCGSLVCYLTGITAVDPIPYGLLFERFIDITRTDVPDIDIDVDDQRRDLIFDYLKTKYGTNRLARLGTTGTLQQKSALNAVGAALKIPKWQLENADKAVEFRAQGDERTDALKLMFENTEEGRKLKEQFPGAELAARLEGHPANAAQHAAGVLMTEEDLLEFVAIDKRTGAAMCDKKDAEDLNFLKIDLLGLTQLSIFQRCFDLAGLKSFEEINLNDPAAYEVLNSRKYSGIFQFAGQSLQRFANEIKFESFEDIASITAIARPGPIDSGAAEQWVKRRSGKEQITYPHAIFEPYLSSTYGLMIYQEQIMQIARGIGEMSWEDVTKMRRAIGRSQGPEALKIFGEPFKKAAIAKGVETWVAEKIWNDICGFGAYAFNRSHAVAYGLVSYYCCWLKAHFPLEFAAATLDAESDPNRQIQLLRELEAEGVGYVPVDAQHSTDKWNIMNGKLIGPLTNIKGIGPVTVAEVLEARKNGTAIRTTLLKKLERAKTPIDSLYPIRDKVKSLDLNGMNIMSKPLHIAEVQCGVKGDVMILAVAKKIDPIDENEPARVTKRGRKFNGPTRALNMFFEDDTGEIFCKIDRFRFDDLGKFVMEKGKAKKSLFAVKGQVPSGFRMISVSNIRYLGELE
jgi:DNA polymerase III alpha subunit